MLLLHNLELIHIVPVVTFCSADLLLSKARFFSSCSSERLRFDVVPIYSSSPCPIRGFIPSQHPALHVMCSDVLYRVFSLVITPTAYSNWVRRGLTHVRCLPLISQILCTHTCGCQFCRFFWYTIADYVPASVSRSVLERGMPSSLYTLLWLSAFAMAQLVPFSDIVCIRIHVSGRFSATLLPYGMKFWHPRGELSRNQRYMARLLHNPHFIEWFLRYASASLSAAERLSAGLI